MSECCLLVGVALEHHSFIYPVMVTLRPGPSFGSTLELGFLGHSLQAYLPRTDDEPQFHEASETFNPLFYVSRIRALKTGHSSCPLYRF